ncbi:MAG TPA: hypothetical protein VFZ03_16010 [Dongiaceae bacterium]
MRTIAFVTIAIVSGLAAGPAVAEGIGKSINDSVRDFYDGQNIDSRTPDQAAGTSLGDAIQGGFYGNAANPRPSTHGTLPSQSPGPSLNNPDDPDNPTPGSSWGNYKNHNPDDDAAHGALNAGNQSSGNH